MITAAILANRKIKMHDACERKGASPSQTSLAGDNYTHYSERKP